MKKVIYIIALLIGATTMAQTITVNGTHMLVSDDISFPFWLESGSSISPEVPVSSISVLEFNIVPNNNGNDMVFNQVISVTSNQTVPEGKTWKVESVLQENQSFEVGNANPSLFIPTSSWSTNITMEAPVYDSITMLWTVNATILPSGGSPISEKGFCYSSTNNQPNVYDTIINSGTGNGVFSEYMINGEEMTLQLNTNYFVCAFATSLEGISYSQVFNFTTPTEITPQVGQLRFGGQIFYVDETGEHGLVAANQSIGNYSWGCENSTVNGADGTDIGMGEQNTMDIVSSCAETLIAASVALTYQNDGYTDWYLPSKDELMLIYSALYIDFYNVNTNYKYWSSTEYNINSIFGWALNFSSGTFLGHGKTAQNLVLPIRSF
jgi:hypothetical protein